MAAYCLKAVPLAFLCLVFGELYLEKYAIKKPEGGSRKAKPACFTSSSRTKSPPPVTL